MIDQQHLIYLYYSLLSFFKTSIHYIHLVYYVQTYISIYRINSSSFWIAESLFLLWNTLNDPLFGWFSDRYITCIHHRLDYLIICTPLFSLSSLLFWYPFVEINSSFLGLQLVFSLCLYDTFLTMIDLNYNSLLIDISIHKRETLCSASAIGNALGKYRMNDFCLFEMFLFEGSLPLLISYLCWNSSDLRLFRIFVTIITILTMFGFVFVIQSMKRILYDYNPK
jgi:Na+/melibiose symporter-like transporter